MTRRTTRTEARVILSARRVFGCGQNMDTASAPTDVTAFVGRWRVHGLDGAILTRKLEESVGIGHVFVVMPVEGTERHAVAMHAGPDAGGAAHADSAAAAAPAPALYICASDERRTTLSFGLKTHEERTKPSITLWRCVPGVPFWWIQLLRLNACLRSTFSPTSARPHLLSGSRRTKNAESRRRTSSTV